MNSLFSAAMKPVTVHNQRSLVLWLALVTVIIQAGVFIYFTFTTPGYIVPYFHHPVARVVLLGLAICEAAGFATLWISLPVPKLVAIVSSIFVLIFFALPLTITPFVGHLVVTVLTEFSAYYPQHTLFR